MAAKKAPPTRTKGFEDMGSLGDMRDRFRNVYKPGANAPKQKPGGGATKKPASKSGGKRGC